VVSHPHNNMDKIVHSDKNITVFGGLNFIYQAIRAQKLDSYINKELGRRNSLATYKHSDIVLSLFGNCLVQGSHLSDLYAFKEKYFLQRFTKIPSADTVEYVCQQLKTDTIEKTTNKGVTNHVNYSDRMNKALIGLALKSGMLKKGDNNYILDYDNVIIEHNKRDARTTYKKTRGYHPAFAFVGRIPVHIENRNGNTSARYQQKETLARCFEHFKEAGIRISTFRADAASYQKEVIDLVCKHTDTFYIRLHNCLELRNQCGEARKWKKVVINHMIKEVASIEYNAFGGDVAYRGVIIREQREDKQGDLFSSDAYEYFGLLTNDWNKDEEEIIALYNKRGDAENSNKYMLNDFNLHHLPFSDLSTNTVFMYLMAMCSILFEWTKHVLVLNKARNITMSMRVKAVCFHYVTVATTFIKHARTRYIKVFALRGSYRELRT
jgi:Transposase DDE domain group 1